jgi:hypothetical protein
MDSDAFVVRFEPHRLRIENQSLVLDGVALSPLSATTTNIHVLVLNLTMTITGDGTQVLMKSLRR